MGLSSKLYLGQSINVHGLTHVIFSFCLLMIKKKVIIILKATQRNPVEHREGDSSVTLLMKEVASKTLLPDAVSIR